jgi:hypothetical protein
MHAHNFAALAEGTLAVQGRFSLGNHVQKCRACQVTLLLMLEEMRIVGGPARRDTEAVAAIAGIDSNQPLDWVCAMFGGGEYD